MPNTRRTTLSGILTKNAIFYKLINFHLEVLFSHFQLMLRWGG